MSVINQMLKDIEKRQPQTSSGTPSHQAAPNNNVLLIVLVTLLNLLLVLAGYWVWQRVPVEQLESRSAATAAVVSNTQQDKLNQLEQDSDKEAEAAESLQVSANQQLKQQLSAQPPKPESADGSQAISASPATTAVQPIQNNNGAAKIASTEPDDSAENTRVTERKPESTSIAKPVVMQREPESKSTAKPLITEQPAAKSAFNLEKIDLSKADLLQHKRALLIQAKADQELDKAIQYARELHQLDPQNVGDIAELAALLYAKGEFNLVETLLLSGLRYESGELKLRLMLARLYYKSGRLNNALQVLAEMQPDVALNLDYYVLRASLARELKQFEQGMRDYAQLTQVNSSKGNWWLGYALCADSAAKVTQAIQGYKQALATASLGHSSITFAQQRLQVLEK